MQGNFAKDKTLRRKSNISEPNTSFNIDNEWEVLPKDTVDDIGKHTTNTASISQEFIKNFNIYPNPIKNILSINSINNIKIEKLSIYTYLGKNVININNPKKEINLNSLENGIYILKLQAENKVFTTKLIKK